MAIDPLLTPPVTAAPLEILRSLPLKRLKEYLKAYDIAAIGVKEKEDLVQAVYKARRPTMTLPPENESYYRRRSVPLQGQLPGRRAASSNYPSNGNARPAPRPTPPRPVPQQQQQQRPPPPNYGRPSSSMPGGGPWSGGAGYGARPPPPPPGRPDPTRPPPPRAAQPAPAPAPRPAPPPVPSILSLVALPNSYVGSLSIGTLKAILYENHVRVDFKQVLEKGELIKRVNELVDEERKRLERQRVAEEREAREAAGLAASPPAKEGVSGEAAGEARDEAHEGSTTPEAVAAKAPPPTGPEGDIDRGLCVVCQDEEATLAVVDCGHLAMCQREWRAVACADCRLLGPCHGHEQGVPLVPHAHCHTVSTPLLSRLTSSQAAPHPHLSCLEA